jgi:hypothetical protein
MLTRLPFVLGASIALAILAAFAIGMARPARPPLIAKPPPFESRWQEAPVVPKAVRTIPITPTKRANPVPEPLVAPPSRNYRAPDEIAPHRYVAPEQPKKQRTKKAREERRERGDICRGKGKNWTNNKRSWRCKR